MSEAKPSAVAPVRPFFSYTPGEEFELHETADQAAAECRGAIDRMRDEAFGDEGWSEEVESVCWGAVVQRARVTERIQRPAESELMGGCDKSGQLWPPNADELIDYGLGPVTHGSGDHPKEWTWSFRELIGKGVHAARPHRTTPAPRWVAVVDAFQVGSETAKALCRNFGFDPYEQVPGVKCAACAEEGET